MKLLYDFFPIILFFIAYKMWGIYVATAVAIAAAFVQVGAFWLKHRRFEKMHLVSLGLLTVMGGLTLILHDPLFIKWKPTVINWLFGLAFLGSQFIGGKTLVERMMSKQIQLPKNVWGKLNLSWVGFFALSGLANIYVAYNYSESTWVNFKLFGLLGLTIVFVVIQSIFLARYINVPDGSHQDNQSS